ncbi:formate dehydrogenase accessory sulfurtransferase FdhD [Dinghuibacter silviterrae]|uniref:Sulfur carrier protein FdhD n=1 Tax=Dinghuibacter silviterrae TaxID=1539049 RepID=A0A4R8DH24_9BACT|nr:formate dehydrogenase accessory sulfurtransferase FdhD [Dinghuibacter silviterrae]TDW97001.1 FdhD protein [Dinghuibacter silviterrae]
MENPAISGVDIRRYSGGQLSPSQDRLAVEEPLEIRLVYGPLEARVLQNISVTMRTPGADRELALGFLFTEGILKDIASVLSCTVSGNVMTVEIRPGVVPHLSSVARNFYATSSCGVCGKASIDAISVVSPYRSFVSSLCVPASVLYGLPTSLTAAQDVFALTGGLHASALFDPEGHLWCMREDVGRHNALDKVIGFAFSAGMLPLDNSLLLLSGRAGFELIQKAAMAGIKVVAAIGPPSSLALQLARENGMTLVGFLRGEKFNVYCGEERINL